MFDIITDSACDLTLDTAKQLGIEVVPFYVSLDGEHYRKEGLEIPVRDFYQFMVDNPAAYPKTSLASIEDFEKTFRAHAEAGRAVLCLVFTGKMSGCVGSARNARDLVLEDYPDARIEVIDSAAATVTESTMVENAVAMRDAGCTLDETVTWLEAEKSTNQIFFTVGDLDYLIKGGRIGKVTGRAANILGIKPMILFKEGEIFSAGVARGRQKSFEKALDLLMTYLAEHNGTPDDYCITVGMKEINFARKIRMLMPRDWNAAILRKALHGPITCHVPVSLFQNHPDAKIYALALAATTPVVPEIRVYNK